jgi:DNA repair exonuclease SbcCD ATPase subunit
MRILYIKLENFIGVYAAMKRKSIELSFDNIDKPIIQIYGPNRSGKSVLEQQLHPFSSISLNGDERNDLPLIIKGEVGIKNIVYEVNGKVYNILHTYKPTGKSHTVSSSVMVDGEEINPSGGVGTFNDLIEKYLGINRYSFQFTINGTQLTSFAQMNSTQRKNIMNKAMGIDIYDKIHKLSTDDYRYANKLITSLSNTKEFILSQYGSYENMITNLNHTKEEHKNLNNSILETKSMVDKLSGKLSFIQQQNPQQELDEINRTMSAYNSAISVNSSILNGEDISSLYDKLVSEQMALNNKLNELRSERLIIRKDLDILYDKKNNIESSLKAQQNFLDDIERLSNTKESLQNKIDNMQIQYSISVSSDTMRSIYSLSQMINSTCKEIVMCLSKEQLKLFSTMISTNVDINAFIAEESSFVSKGENEKKIISDLHALVNGVQGQYPDSDKCLIENECIYKHTVDTIKGFFRSYQQANEEGHKLTAYDIENLSLAYKNLQSIYRMLESISIPSEVQYMFDVNLMFTNLCNGKFAIDSNVIKDYMEEAAKVEMRERYIKELKDIENTISTMKNGNVNISYNNFDIQNIENQISELSNKDSKLSESITMIEHSIKSNDMNRMSLSQIKNVNVKELSKRKQKLEKMIDSYNEMNSQYLNLNGELNSMINKFNILSKDLETLEHANAQYLSTDDEIKKNKESDYKYKVIAEATSSTKGKPVLAIRDMMDKSKRLTNRLLDVMYTGEIQILEPIINEAEFTIPFRCGGNVSNDIRYGSQSESTLISLTLSLSLASSLTKYNIRLLDEIDGFMDQQSAEVFVLMLNEMIGTLGIDQMFIISHKMAPHAHDEIVHVLDIGKTFGINVDD